MKVNVEEPEAVGEEEEAKEPPAKLDLEEIAFYFRQAGIAIPQRLLFTINIAMKKLTQEQNLLKARWVTLDSNIMFFSSVMFVIFTTVV